MQYHVITLDARHHAAFLEQRRRDPVTKEEFKPGDRVVMCAACRSAFLEASWRAFGRSHCGQQRTLKTLAVDISRRRFSRREPAAAPPPTTTSPPPPGTTTMSPPGTTTTPPRGTTTPPRGTMTPPMMPTPAGSPPASGIRASASGAAPAPTPTATASPPTSAPSHLASKGHGTATARPLGLKSVPLKLADVGAQLRPILQLREAPE